MKTMRVDVPVAKTSCMDKADKAKVRKRPTLMDATGRKHLIWTNDLNYEDWREDLEAEYPNATERERMDLMYEINNDYLDDERCNLNIQLNHKILIIANLGLWNGRRLAYKEIKSGNIRDCLYGYSSDYYNTWYLDYRGDLRCDCVHHDGTNYLMYRVWKPNVKQSQMDRLKNKLYAGKATRDEVSRLTMRLGDVVADVYGWNIK